MNPIIDLTEGKLSELQITAVSEVVQSLKSSDFVEQNVKCEGDKITLSLKFNSSNNILNEYYFNCDILENVSLVMCLGILKTHTFIFRINNYEKSH